MKAPAEFVQEVQLLEQIWLKNRSQHRAQMWWKYFEIFLRRVRQMARRNRLDEAVCRYLCKFTPQFWRAMHTALAQGAFVTIVFAVMAAAARLFEVMQVASEHRRPTQSETATTGGEDLGQVVDGYEALTIAKTKPSKPKSKKSAKKKRPSRDAIDDIFG